MTNDVCRRYTTVLQTTESSGYSPVIEKLDNVATANSLQLEAARLRAVPIPFIFVSRAKFELAQPIRCRLRAFYCSYVTLRCDLEL